MKIILTIMGCIIFSSAAYASNCDAVKANIDAKIRANGVQSFTLEAVEKGTATEGKVVGYCGGGTKDIVYTRGNTSQPQAETVDDAE